LADIVNLDRRAIVLGGGNREFELARQEREFGMQSGPLPDDFGELETVVRCGIPLLVTALNDQALGSEYHKMRAHNMQADLATISTPDLGAVARSFGGAGRLATTIEDVRAAATEWLANPGLMVIDARISRNVVSVPYRRLHYGRDE